VKKTKFEIYSYLASLLLVATLSNCRMTRYVPEDEHLLKDAAVVIDENDFDKKELKSHLAQKENLKILGFMKFHLWLYNLSSKKRDNGLLKRAGEAPVIYNEGLKNKSVSQLQMFMSNKGYYQAEVDDTVLFKRKTARVKYLIDPGEPYRIRNVDYVVKDKHLLPLVNNSRDEAYFSKGDVLDVELLENERSRLTKLLRNSGYYNFSEDFIHYEIDTTRYRYLADVDLIIESSSVARDENKGKYHKKFSIDNYSVFVGKQNNQDLLTENSNNYSDSLSDGKFTFYFNDKIPLKENVIYKTIEMFPDNIYQQSLEDKTYNNLYTIRQFKYVDIRFNEVLDKGDSLNGYLDGQLYLPLQVKQNYSFDIEGTNTSGDLGIAGNLNYQHRNLFRGAEIFDVTLRGATEQQITGTNDEKYNTIEYGGRMRLTVPGFVFPINENKLNLHSIPFTTFSVAYNYQNRPYYTRTIVNATLGYKWRSDKSKTHNLNLLDLNAVRIFSLNDDFIDQIKDLYIRSSYTDHIISSSNYSFTYSKNRNNNNDNYVFYRMNIEAAGNFLWGLSNVLNRKKVEPEPDAADQSLYYEYFNTRFAQYVRGDFDYRYGYRFDKYNMIATRAFFGIAFPYGNFNLMPFEKQYFTGGANGVRAWHVRSLGPGSYSAPEGEYPNQSADLKLEANIEYRFKLFWMLEGALFVDAGNVWAINSYDNREGAVFKFDRFYNEFAVGTGMGLRLVSPYFILRVDLGLKLRDPSLETGKRWIHVNRGITTDDLNFNIAIGYPF
jgi:hypothetical protein